MYLHDKVIRQKEQETCMDEQRAPSISQRQERNLWDMEKGTGQEGYGNIVKICWDAMKKAKTHLEL